MKQLQMPSDLSSWEWPLDLNAYDRTPVLSEDEYRALEQKINSPHHAQFQRRPWRHLTRLFQPIEDALAHCSDGQRHTRDEVIRVMAREMYRRRTPFWAWSLEDWLETAGESDASFAQRYGWTRNPISVRARRYIPRLAYMLCLSLSPEPFLEKIDLLLFAKKFFGTAFVESAVAQVLTVLQSWGYRQKDQGSLALCICYLLLKSRNPYLANLTMPLLEETLQTCSFVGVLRTLFQVSRALNALGIVEGVVHGMRKKLESPRKAMNPESISEEWLSWCERWHKQSTLQNARHYYYVLRNIGRWLYSQHPEITSPAQWTDEFAAKFVRAVYEWKVGEWSDLQQHQRLSRSGQPLLPSVKESIIRAARAFFRDCQEWGWIPVRLNVRRMLRTPHSIQQLIGLEPRTIEKEFWAKLLWAAMNLEKKDLPVAGMGNEANWYPLELHRAVAIVWCFAALRSDEVARLRVGCTRWQHDDVMIPETGDILPQDAICFLDIPVNKTSRAYTKAVHPLVGKRIQEWERIRPQQQPYALDRKTGETVQFLFFYRGRRLPNSYINTTLIPILCHKAGIPLEDSRGKITSHRARATIASMLYNAKEPLSIFELKDYLGRKYLSSTQHYLDVDPTKLASKVAQSGYLEQNMATIEVLLDQEAILNGAASRGEAWKYYDLGHGYCTNPFWAQCAHRMACARCPFYRPKDSLKEQLVEGKANLVHMLEFVSLTEDEKVLVTEGVELHQELIKRLANVPTPAGPTPRELQAERQQDTKVIPLKSVRRTRNQKSSEQ